MKQHKIVVCITAKFEDFESANHFGMQLSKRIFDNFDHQKMLDGKKRYPIITISTGETSVPIPFFYKDENNVTPIIK